MTLFDDKANPRTRRHINFCPLIRAARFIATPSTSLSITYYLLSAHCLVARRRNTSTDGFVVRAGWRSKLAGSSHDPEVERLPYRRPEVIGGATLYLGDCRQILPTLLPVSQIITDPPYEQEAHTKGRRLLGKQKNGNPYGKETRTLEDRVR